MRRSDQALDGLRKYLLQQGFSEQQQLPPERDLAEMLGLTRNQLRGGLKRLAAEGLIWRRVGKGTFFGQPVLPAAPSNPQLVLSDVITPHNVMEARIAFEPEVARYAAFRATRKNIAEIERCLDQMPNNYGYWDGRLHLAIAEASGNMLMKLMFDTIHASRGEAIWKRLGENTTSESRREEVAREHAAIAEAIRQRHPEEAAAQMRFHLLNTKRITFGEN
jgi:GntR family transcriptional regulator, transcriptional repressor for pyruvate dehydrogenase complex